MDHSPPRDLVAELQRLLACNDIESQKDTRKQAGSIAHQLWLDLEEAGDIITRVIFQNQETAMLNLAMDMGIYSYLVNKRSGSEMNGAANGVVNGVVNGGVNAVASSEEVAKHTGAEPVLMQRILRNLAALGHVDEADADVYRANKFSRAFTTTAGVAGFRCARDFATPAWAAIPSFLKSMDYRNPTDPMNTPLQKAFETDKHFFEILVENNFLNDFQTFMSNYRVDRAEFLDVYPAETQLLPGGPKRDEEVLMVDVGGGHGHEIELFVKKFPEKRGRMILQDQPNIVSEVKSENFEVMGFDFFTPQPVKGARAYYFRMIFHDWPDEQCLSILQNVTQAMKPGFSKLIINDVVLPEKGAGRFATQSDITMLSLLAAMERTEAQWRALLECGGLKNVKIWYGEPESVIEAEV